MADSPRFAKKPPGSAFRPDSTSPTSIRINQAFLILGAAALLAAPHALFADFQDAKIAFIGDQGSEDKSRAVLELIKAEGADIVLHQGDFDYQDNPKLWDGLISSVLGKDFPYLASLGNHDVPAKLGYQRVLRRRLARTPEVNCRGIPAVRQTCKFRGIDIVLVAPGIRGNKYRYANFIRKHFRQSRSAWRICSWHKNMTKMQLGRKGNATGWDVYEACRVSGAMIATGHDHTYARTYLMKSFGRQRIADKKSIVLRRRRSFAFVSGLGGASIRRQRREAPWWASVYTKDQKADAGALFCTLRNNATGSCYFKDIQGRIPDRFSLATALSPISPATVIRRKKN